MHANNSRWQRVLGFMVTLIMVFALVVPTSVNATKAPVPQSPARIETTDFHSARFVGQTNGTAAQIAERAYGPSRGVAESLTGKGSGPFKEQVGSWKLPWAKSKRVSAPTLPKPRSNDANTADRKKIFDESPSPDLDAFWEGLNMGGNRTLFGFGFLPPDTNGDTSYRYYVETVNTIMAVWDYNDVNVYGGWPKTVLGPMPMNLLWAGTGTSCEATNDGDPVVRYDDQADRWVITQFALPIFNGLYPSPFAYPFAECIAVSTTGDPTGSYYLYEFVTPNTGIDDDGIQSTPQVSGAKMPDYPKFGVYSNAYYMSVNQFDEINFDWGGAGIYMFERSAMLLGLPASMGYIDPYSIFDCSAETLYTTETNAFCFMGGMLPADNDGAFAAGDGVDGTYFMQFDDDAWSTPAYVVPDALELWEVGVVWGSYTYLGGPWVMPVDPFDSDMCGYSRNCIQQPGTTVRLDSISDRLMDRLNYRQIDRTPYLGPLYEVMVTNHTVDVGGDRAGVRWYELRRDWSGSWGPWYVYQQGTQAPDTDSRWMGSMAVDAVGNLALGYTVSSASTYPTIRYTTHAVTDPLGTMRDEVAITSAASAAGSQTSTSHRWGDYSSMTVADSCSFVYTSEYLRGTTPAEWYTRMGMFSFNTCYANDVEGPWVHIFNYPANPSVSRYAYFDWHIDYEATGLDYYECRLDGEPWWTCSPYHEFYGLSSGWHTFDVRAFDTLGNVGYGSYTWEVTAQTSKFVSAAGADGHLVESSEFSDVGGAGSTAAGGYIYVGDYTADRQIKGLMSFNVSLPGGAVVTGARIEYRMASPAGTNPFTTHGPLMVDFATPFFGAAANLAASDFQAAATSYDIAGCSSVPSGAIYTCNLDGSIWGSLSGTVQFRFHFFLDDNDDGGADFLRIISGNYPNASYRPVLVLDYYIP